MIKNLPAVQETWVQSLGWEDPLEEGMATHPSILALEHQGNSREIQELHLQEGLQETSVREDEGVFLRLRSESRDSGVIPQAPVGLGPMRLKPGAA